MQSLLDLLATFQKWNPAIAENTTTIRKLIMKGVKFNWLKDVHEKELETILISIRNLLLLSPFDPDLKSHVYTNTSTVGFSHCLLQLKKEGKFNVVASSPMR